MTEHSQHTPGPWSVRPNDTHVYATGNGGSNVCSCSEPRASRLIGYTEPDIGSPGLDEAVANARLIAALPCLLRELRTSLCPGGGYTGQPEGEEPTVDNCLKAGVCGCTAGAAVAKAIGLVPARIAERERG